MLEKRKAMNTIAMILASPIRTAIVSDLKDHKSERYGVLKEHVEKITGSQISPGSFTWHLEKLKGVRVIDKAVPTDKYYLTKYGEEVRGTITVATEQIRSITETTLSPASEMVKLDIQTNDVAKAVMRTRTFEIKNLPLKEIARTTKHLGGTLESIVAIVAEIEAAIEEGKLDPSVRILPFPEAVKKLEELKEH